MRSPIVLLAVSLFAVPIQAADDATLPALIKHARAESESTLQIDLHYDIRSQRAVKAVSRAVLASTDAETIVNQVAKSLAISKTAAAAVTEARLRLAELDRVADEDREVMDNLVTVALREAPQSVDVIAFCATIAADDKNFAARFLPLTRGLAPAESVVVAEAVNGSHSLQIVADALRRAPDESALHEALTGLYDGALDQTFGPVRFEGRKAVFRKAWSGRAVSDIAFAGARQIDALTSAGRADAVLAAFDALPQPVRDRILAGRLKNDGPMVDVRLDLAASALVSGDAVRAEAFTRGVVPQKTEDSYDQEGLAQRLEVLRAALATKRDGDLYDVLAATINSAARPRGGVWTRVVADLARGGGYDAFAAAVLRYAWAPSHELADEALTLLPDVLRDELRATLDQEAAAQASAVAQVAPSGTILKRLSAPRVNAFIERPLPESIAAGERVVIDCEDASRTAASMHIPAGWYPIRLERSGSEVAGVAISRAIDPMGEVGRGGYWVLHSADGGATWDEPLYTGLRENAPYVVVPASRLPLAGDRSLAVEVEVHEIDPASITFPPIGLRAKREARGLYIELSWDALRRDTDRDGLTDLLEDHLGTDIESADTDGDGITDAKDGLPQVALTAGVTPEAQILAKLLTDFYAGGGAIIVGLPGTDEERSACVIRSSAVGAPALFVVGNRDLFSAIDINRRVIVFTPQELEAYTKKFGPTYAADVTLMIVRRDGRKALVVVNESWKENVFELEKTPKGWVMKTVGGWIS